MAEQVAAPGPTTSVDPRVEARLTSAGRVIRWIATVYAVLGLLGMVVPPLRSFPPGPSLVRELYPVTAISLAALALSALLAGDVSRAAIRSVALRRLGLVLSWASAVFGAFIMYTFITDQTEVWGVPTRMPSFAAGTILVALGVAVPLSVSRIETRVIAGQVASLLVFSLTAVVFLGYVYGDPSVGRLFLEPEISFQASIISVLTASGVLLIRPASGLLSTASSPGAGGRVLRRFGPLVLFTPALLLLIAETVPTGDRIDVLAFISVGLGLFLLILLSVFVKALDETAIEASTSAAEAERARIGLEQEAPVVTRMAEILHTVDLGETEGWEVATRFRPGSGSVAGDASAVRLMPDGTLGLVLVDLTGHGAEPTVWAVRLRDLLLHSLISGASPAEAMSAVEWATPGDALASAVVLALDSETGEARLASAGHPPLVVVGTQEVELKPPTGPLLFLTPGSVYSEAHFKMGNGETVVTFSDGIADVQLTINGLTQPEILADMLLAEGGNAARTADLVLGFAAPEPSDDQTVVVIRRTA